MRERRRRCGYCADTWQILWRRGAPTQKKIVGACRCGDALEGGVEVEAKKQTEHRG